MTIQWFDTHCARMDHGGCALKVGVENGKIVKISGNPDGWLNRGYVCPKGLASADKLDHPDRLKYPLKRSGARGKGCWTRISWDEALETVSTGLSRVRDIYGAKGVAFCQGMPKGLEHFVMIRLANLFGSPNVVAVQDVCHAPREVTGIHTCGFYPVADFHHKSELVLAWGANITATNEEGGICRILLDQLRQGTKLMVVDPVKTALAERAAIWLPVKPGTDAALALAFLHTVIEEKLYDRDFVEKWTEGFAELSEHVRAYSPEKISDITGVPARIIREAARLYATSRPAALAWGNAVEQNSRAFDTTRALVCLMAICGNLDVPGGNIQAVEPKILPLGAFVRADRIPDKAKTMIHARQTLSRLMTVPPAFFRDAVLEDRPYPVRAAYIQCANPVMGYADTRRTREALMKLDFLAVSDIFMTPTAALADIVLPAATQFEFNDIGHYGLGHGIVLARPKIVNPPEECWPDIRILNELGKRVSADSGWPDDWEEMLAEILEPSGMSYEDFARKGYLKGADRFMKYAAKGFRTASGRVELRLDSAEKFGLPPLPEFDNPPDDPEFPLILTTGKEAGFLHSSYRWMKRLRERTPEPLIRIHPSTAAWYGIADGAPVSIETRYGRIVQTARLTPEIRPDTVWAASGWWFPENEAEAGYTCANYNMLTSAEKTGRAFGTPDLRGIRCRIQSAGD